MEKQTFCCDTSCAFGVNIGTPDVLHHLNRPDFAQGQFVVFDLVVVGGIGV